MLVDICVPAWSDDQAGAMEGEMTNQWWCWNPTAAMVVGPHHHDDISLAYLNWHLAT